MLVSHRYKFIYLKARKVAGTSTEAFFEKYCRSIQEENTYKHRHASDEYVSQYGIIGTRMNGNKGTGTWYNHKPISEIISDLGEDKYLQYYKICNVRNPFDMSVSLYHDLGGTKVDKQMFFKFLKRKDVLRLLQCNKDMWSIHDNEDFCYIRFEQIDQDLLNCCKKVGIIPLGQLPEYKKNNHRKNYQLYFNEDSINIIEKLFKDEINYFNYKY